MDYDGGGRGTISSHGVLVTLNVKADSQQVRSHVRKHVEVTRDGYVQIFFAALSSDTKQDVHWVHAHLQQMRHELETVYGFRATSLHMWSDNCSEQYKCQTALARAAAFDIPFYLNFYQVRHGKSVVDCYTSVWRRLTDDYNAQNLQRQLLQPAEIVEHWRQHHKLPKTSVLHSMHYQLLNEGAVKAERSNKQWLRTCKCPGIAAAHSFELQQPCADL